MDEYISVSALPKSLPSKPNDGLCFLDNECRRNIGILVHHLIYVVRWMPPRRCVEPLRPREPTRPVFFHAPFSVMLIWICLSSGSAAAAYYAGGSGRPWYWSIICKFPSEPMDRGNAASLEEARQAVEAR